MLKFAEITVLETNSRFQYALLAAITLLAAALRFYKLGAWGFWIDEVFTVGHVQVNYGDLESIIRNIPPTKNWIPLSSIVTGQVLNVLGVSEWSARLVPAIIGVISIPALYFPIKRLFSPGVGLVAVLLLAVSPWHVFWSQNARFYTSLLLLYALAAFAFFLGVERDRTRYILIFMLLTYLATSERLFALFIVPVIVFYLVLTRVLSLKKSSGLHAKNIALMLFPAFAYLLCDGLRALFLGRVTLIGFFADAFIGYSNHSPLRLLFSIAYRIGIPAIGLGVAGGVYILAKKQRAGLFIFSAALIPPLALILIAPFAFTVDRYVFVTLPFWAVLGAIAIKELFAHLDGSRRILALGALTVLVGTAMGDNALYYEYQNGGRPDWKGAFAFVEQRKTTSDLVASTRPEVGEYYLGESITQIDDVDPRAIENDDRRVWFVIGEPGVGDPELLQWIVEHCELTSVRDVSLPGKTLEMRVYLYDPLRRPR